jgi:adenylate kinase
LTEEETFKRLALRAQKEGRADDTEEAIRLRLKQYYEATLPILDFMKAKTRFVEIDGLPAVEVVEADIQKKLGI